MTLRRRLTIAAAVTAAAIVVLAIVVTVQFWITSASQRALFDRLAPAADASAALVLAQTDASGAVADHLILGDDASLAQYGRSVAKADTLLTQLDDAITDDMEQLDSLHVAAAKTQAAWVQTDARPALALMADDRQVRAARQYASAESRASYTAMIDASQALHDRINEVRGAAAEAVTGFTTRLGLTLFVVGLIVVAGLVALLAAVRQWILLPLTELRGDIRRAARLEEHTEPIDEVGPPEIAAVARDAEFLRRQLVEEIDEAVAAREGLMQDAPLVAAMSAELRGPESFHCDFADVASSSLAAEGVVAGDWWDVVPRPHGAFALVVADASGHGPEAGIAALRVRTVLRSALDAGLPLEQAAAMGARACGRDEHFVTALLMEVAPDGTLRWVNAGHHPALVVTADKQASTLTTTGPLLSVLGGTWSVEQCSLAAGDIVLAFTDGLVEARTVEGEELGTSDLETYLRGLDGHVRTSADETVQRVTAHARTRAVNFRRDDVTVVGIAFHG